MGRMTAKKDPALAAALGDHAHVLAQGRDHDDAPVVVGTVDRIAVRRGDTWVMRGWDEVERGSWNAESGTLTWSDMRGEPFTVQLAKPGQFPMLFQERVQASTVVTVQRDLEQGEVRIVARRRLSPEGGVTFYAIPSGGARLSDATTAAIVVEETDRLKTEYGLS